MSRCGRTHLMEAVALGEASPEVAQALREHATGCPRCRHELRWLETERQLFRQRAGREEVEALWRGVTARAAVQAPRRRGRVLGALAASALALLGVARFSASPLTARPVAVEEGELESSLLMSPVVLVEAEAPCSRLPTGLGFSCGPAVPASFLASR